MALILYCFLEGDAVKQHIINGGINCVACVTRGQCLKATTGECVWALSHRLSVCLVGYGLMYFAVTILLLGF